jgi:hypothetical protein
MAMGLGGILGGETVSLTGLVSMPGQCTQDVQSNAPSNMAAFFMRRT